MHDIKYIRENPKDFDESLSKRGISPISEEILALDVNKRTVMTKVQSLQSRRNEIASLIGLAKKENRNTDAISQEAVEIKELIFQLEAEEQILDRKLQDILASIPNIPLNSVPLGKNEEGNVCIRTWGKVPEFNFSPLAHYELGEKLKMIDFDTAAKISGSRFTLLRGQMAQLERAIKNFMIDVHTQEFGYEEVSVPFLVRTESMYGTGQLPKFSEDLFCTKDNRWLIPTAEVPLTNIVREKTIDVAELPYRFTAYSACFRSEAGAAGKDTRGMIRNHQFSKVELVSIVHPKDGESELERMTAAAESILQKLELSYRVMLLCSGDMGFASKKTYDIEVWVPSENKYREISSCSFCGDFQARRMNARYKDSTEKGFVCTLNGSGLAIGRTIVAILENYQNSDGSVTIPEVLVPYMNKRRKITNE